jgi:competence protein ComEC
MGEGAVNAALQQTPWRNRVRLSSLADAADAFLAGAGMDRGPWIAVAVAAGIAAWFALPGSGEWIAAMAGGLLLAVGAVALWRDVEHRSQLMLAGISLGLALAAGIALIWARSELVGAQPIAWPASMAIEGRVLERIEQPAEDRVRLVLATRERDSGRAIKVRINVPLADDHAEAGEGALVRLRARLMPPAPPMLPGSYDFARAAWFQGYAATGGLQGELEVIEPAGSGGWIARQQRRLSGHVRDELDGQPGAIAAAFASGDRGAITSQVEEAMRDAGLTHLLSISGLHVSAVIAAAYFVAMKLLALWPWLALRVRLPVAAALVGALAGIAYTLLTGAQVPTVRSCAGALLVLGALAIGREPLSMRLVAVAAIFVLMLWPESLVGPSFQMSFAAVIAIIALAGAAPVKAFLAPREESVVTRWGRRAVMLLVTGFVIEIALMPIVLFHFHRAGFYGALANVVAIPLVTFISMPLIAIALLFDIVGLGAPFWWLAGKSLELLLAIADFTASRPGAVKLTPAVPGGALLLFVGGALWLALWRGRARLAGLVPMSVAALLIAFAPVPDMLVSGDGRHVGIVTEGGRLLVLREGRSSYARDNLLELAGLEGEPVPLESWDGAECSREFCVATLQRGGRDWHLLMARSRELVTERALAAACERADIVIADRYLPRSCEPRWLKADRRMLDETGGLSIDLERARVTTVADGQGEHGWWRGS